MFNLHYNIYKFSWQVKKKKTYKDSQKNDIKV